ncbi:L,D-transpeptidase family protein [uncultured Mucilaginibacter sp.]|uniref:L,D-transpeptidase family protein n=1 Tax=uncultured Mucilaginibacter sp. TaxID=797541 RepID=UPI0025FDBE48|nr:L,D-transpeptidase family protein [uncultured Mucilaginibacter sp.]
METHAGSIIQISGSRKICFLLVFFVTGFFVFCNLASAKQANGQGLTADKPDTAISVEIKSGFERKSWSNLLYPTSVLRFYQRNGFQPVWVDAAKSPKQTWEAMLMLDCVLQFGLSHDDYHPKDLSYDLLHNILEKPLTINDVEKAKYDIMLTDAVIAFMNHLHYGKLNPEFTADKIDKGIEGGFNADAFLATALPQKDFMKSIISVQPKVKAYADLQYQMHLLEGVYQGDCYDIPDSTVRRIAANMERLRWAGISDSAYIDINIPSYTLKFHQPDTTYAFKVIVGKPSWPTPTLNSAVSYFTTAPEWRVPKKIFETEILPKALKDHEYLESNQISLYEEKGNYISPGMETLEMISNNPGKYTARQSAGCDNSMGLIVFRFPNVYDIYLHDTPEQQLFNEQDRDFSHGCIRVEQAEKLAGLMLALDGSENLITDVRRAIKHNKTQNFILKKAIPIKVTYLTCEVQNGVIVVFKDVYGLDKRLEMALYNVIDPLALFN